ncbi:hypothetical protein SCWH03_15670 [Streptomyces pacificus]|uniref:Uncharacterized protein n=1 Tax=Streptomyces pacificus TaxID=2705029 RepID=A0A6A0AR56_9ACTN|nr:hypothetical protein SCWH03_15670 [Streptomyces pacificus]
MAVRVRTGGGRDTGARGDDAAGDHGDGEGLLQVVHFGILLGVTAAGPPQLALENARDTVRIRHVGDIHTTV